MSELPFMRIVCWAVMRASLAHVARTRSNERCTRVVRSVIWWDVIGRLMSSHVGSSRYKSGQSGRYFFLALFCCYVFASVLPHLESVPGSGKFSTTHADARLAPVTWRLGRQSVVSGRLMSSQVDPSRSRSIQVVWFSFFWRLCGWVCGRLLAVFVGSWAVHRLARVLPRLQIPCTAGVMAS